MNRYRSVVIGLFAALVAHSVQAAGKVPDAKETVVLQRVAVPGAGREMGMGISEFPPNAVKPKHKATGPEVCYVLEGELSVQIEGQPVKVVHAGETYQIPANVVHVTSAGPAGAKVVASWVWVPGTQFNIAVPG
ncbi:cupin domain-containing protein [Trinickia fusca]|uniref:Cupin domain-containing protein n=1 Tax=Trinickia fusca TaxID=2419777 RepID=A0A494XE59_9BURK|nr:cupin domain-containing protein [Trinickia fusca]RKP48172.1 cupin domain-containing protein [Trinickia fusca]